MAIWYDYDIVRKADIYNVAKPFLFETVVPTIYAANLDVSSLI